MNGFNVLDVEREESAVTFLTTNAGQRVAFTDHGGDGPAVLFLHAFLTNGPMFWAPQVAALSGRYRCITIDARGHGETPADSTFTYWDVAADAVAVLDLLGVDRTFIVGTSQGGFIGLRVALLAPERVAGIALMGTTADAEDPEVAKAYLALAAGFDGDGGSGDGGSGGGTTGELLNTVAQFMFGPKYADEWTAIWQQGWQEGSSDFDLKAILMPLIERDGLLHRLREVTCPALVLYGADDPVLPMTRAEEIVRGLPNAEPLVVVPGGAHFVSYTEADAVNQQIGRFLAAHAG